MSPQRLVVVGVLAALGVLTLVVGALVFRATFSLADQPCNENDNFPGGFIVLVGGACFVAGHFLGHWRDVTDRHHYPRRGRLLPTRKWLSHRTSRVVHITLAVVFGVGLLLLVYESIALRNPWGLRPITSYVRCAKTVSPGITLLATSVVGFLLGHWLWYPERREHR
jgi:hypothetical protein